MITPADLDRLEALARAATPGPWHRGQTGNFRIYGLDGIGQQSGPIFETLPRYHPGDRIANAAFITEFNPSTVLRLIAECRRKM